ASLVAAEAAPTSAIRIAREMLRSCNRDAPNTVLCLVPRSQHPSHRTAKNAAAPARRHRRVHHVRAHGRHFVYTPGKSRDWRCRNACSGGCNCNLGIRLNGILTPLTSTGNP
ncbi:hypothetical protein, partial [Xanthomonas sp. LMG 12459]|uniref:hypothetical protein n=1 Tax=Xanthomonas sp. LMG 12459 TaxID=1591131 RepID=UPI001D059F00